MCGYVGTFPPDLRFPDTLVLTVALPTPRPSHGSRQPVEGGHVKQVLVAVASISTLALTVSACGGASSEGSDGTPGGPSEAATLTVFAAASLTSTFEQLADQFEKSHEGVDVQLSFAGSSDLVTQVREGAPADVIATADEQTMQQLVDAGDVAAAPRAFVSNTLVIAVPTGNPEGIGELGDLTGPDLDVVVCAPQVPCGAATETVEESAGLEIDAVSEEPAVTDVLGKVANGQADAGLVYRTDAAGSDSVDAVEFPESADAVNLYPIAPLAHADDAELAQQFTDFVLSDEARAVFDAAGFARP